MKTTLRRALGRPPQQGLAETRRHQILQEATRLFAAQGFQRTDLQDVADNLKIGKGTVYRYFPAKRELFLAAVDRGMCLLRDRLDAALASESEPIHQIEAAIRTYLGFFDDNPEIVELFIQERAEFRNRRKPTYFVHREANIDRWHDLFSKMMKHGQIRVLPVQDITDFISDLLYGMVFTNHFSGRKRSLAAQAERAIGILYSGILAPNRSNKPFLEKRKS